MANDPLIVAGQQLIHLPASYIDSDRPRRKDKAFKKLRLSSTVPSSVKYYRTAFADINLTKMFTPN